SRRRHTRSKRDWSSDVCSSDLEARLLSILEERLQPANRLRQLDELRGKPAGTHEPPVLEQHAEQHLYPFARGAGQLEQAERMSEIGRASCRERGEIAGVGGA